MQHFKLSTHLKVPDFPITLCSEDLVPYCAKKKCRGKTVLKTSWVQWSLLPSSLDLLIKPCWESKFRNFFLNDRTEDCFIRVETCKVSLTVTQVIKITALATEHQSWIFLTTKNPFPMFWVTTKSIQFPCHHSILSVELSSFLKSN